MTFDPNTSTIGGGALPLVHMTVMSQVYGLIPQPRGRNYVRLAKALKGCFDLLNYPLAAVELLLLVPPWPLYSGHAWAVYLGATYATGATISATAKKVLAQKPAP